MKREADKKAPLLAHRLVKQEATRAAMFKKILTQNPLGERLIQRQRQRQHRYHHHLASWLQYQKALARTK